MNLDNILIPWGRANFMLDFVSLAMLIILPILAYSIYLVKVKRQFALHRRIQIPITIVLFVTVIIFEVNLRLVGWRHLAVDSIYYETLVFPALYIHLSFAIPTPFIWGFTFIQALRKFGRNPEPNDYSPRHKVWAWISVGFLTLTSITGGVFYILAYIC